MTDFPETDAPLLVVAGPTASGKSALAIDAACEFGGVVIAADSMQIYRELSVLTARPSADEEAQVPHRLFGVLPVAEACSAAHWLEMARGAVAEARGEGRLPIVVGGTGLYLKALGEGLVLVPDIPEAVVAEGKTRLAEVGGEAFRDELAALDAAAAERLPAGDSQRMVRAWAVATATGRPLSDWQADAGTLPPVAGRIATIALLPERSDLYAACDARFDIMMERGALDEVRVLLALGLDADLPAMKAVGVPELGRYLAGEWTLDDAAAKAKQATRNYAKRQLTWLRHQGDPEFILSAQYSKSVKTKIFSFIRRFLLTGGG